MAGSGRSSYENLTVMETLAVSRISDQKEDRLKGRLLSRRITVVLIFRTSLLCPIQLKNRVNANLPDTLPGVSLLAVVFAAAELAHDLDMRALGQGAGELRKLAEDNTAMP